jgi:hypothetical protein
VAREEPGVQEHESAQRAVAREEPDVLNGQPSNSSSSQSYIATLKNRNSIIETQNQNLQMRITTLEQTVKRFMDTTLALSFTHNCDKLPESSQRAPIELSERLFAEVLGNNLINK